MCCAGEYIHFSSSNYLSFLVFYRQKYVASTKLTLGATSAQKNYSEYDFD